MDQPSSASVTPSEDTTSLSSSEYSLALTSPDSERSESVPRSEYFLASQDTPEPSLPSTESSIYPSTESEFGITSPSIVSEIDVLTSSIISELDQSSMSHDLEMLGPPVLSGSRDLALQGPSRPPGAELPRPLGRQPTSSQARPLIIPVADDGTSDSDHRTSSVSLSIFSRETSSGSACSGRRRYSSESPPRPDIGLLTELPELVEDIPASEDIPAPVGPVGLAVVTVPRDSTSDSDHITSSVSLSIFSRETSSGSACSGRRRYSSESPHRPDIGLLTELPELVEDIPASEDIPAPVCPVGLVVNPTAASSAAGIQSDSDEVPTSSIARPLMSPKKGSPVVGHIKEKPGMPLDPASSDAEVSIKMQELQVEFKRPLSPGSIHPPIEIPPADPIVPAISPVSPDDNPVQLPVDNTNAPPPAEQPAPVDPVTAGNNTSRDSTPDVQTNCLACLQRLCKCKK